MKISKLLPASLRQYVRRVQYRIKYDLILERRTLVHNTFFEGGNIVRSGTSLRNSYCGFASTISQCTKLNKIKIGKFCSIGQNVKNALGRHPSKQFVSTYPGFYLPDKKRLSFSEYVRFQKFTYTDSTNLYLTELGNDVWIGDNVLLMDGIRIGDGAIIGAGAVVTKDVDPYTIVGGVPAKKIRSRFTNEQIEKLLSIKWWDRDLDWLKKNNDLFSDINLFLQKY